MMNKRCKIVALVGLLAILFMPCISHAQITKPVAERGFQGLRQLFNGGKKVAAERSMIEANLTRAMDEAGLTGLAELYKPREGVKYPDLNSRRDFQELKWLLGGDKVDLSQVTPLQIAQKVQDMRIKFPKLDPKISERWTVFALKHGADESEVLLSARLADDFADVNDYEFYWLTDILINNYGLSVNGTMSDGTPWLARYIQRAGSDAYFGDLPKLDFNVNINGEPLIFSMPKLGEEAVRRFREVAWEIDLHNTLNGIGADPVHMAAAEFKLSEALPNSYRFININKPDNFGNTYAHYAAEGKYAAENIEYLRKQGADLTRVNNRGETPLGILSKRMARLAGLENPAALGHTVDQFVAPRRGPTPRWD